MADSLKARGKTTPIILSREQIESQFGQTLDDAAQKLNVSVSTLKRKCKDKGIKWQGKDRRAIQGDIEGTSLDDNMLTIKVEYGVDVAKLTFPMSSTTFEVIKEEIRKRFKLDPAHFKLKYFDDEDKEWILFTCDEDAQKISE